MEKDKSFSVRALSVPLAVHKVFCAGVSQLQNIVNIKDHFLGELQ